MYPAELTLPMSKDLTDFGFTNLSTPSDVDAKIPNSEGTTLVVVNSVCGCAAANARPGAKMSIQNDKKPDNLYTVFAGVDKEATQRVRDYLLPYPPSSPAIALFKDGKLVHMLERIHIEGRSAQMISENLKMAFDQFC
jgi:putative YphP/YqiW family bacilliredoxin